MHLEDGRHLIAADRYDKLLKVIHKLFKVVYLYLINTIINVTMLIDKRNCEHMPGSALRWSHFYSEQFYYLDGSGRILVFNFGTVIYWLSKLFMQCSVYSCFFYLKGAWRWSSGQMEISSSQWKFSCHCPWTSRTVLQRESLRSTSQVQISRKKYCSRYNWGTLKMHHISIMITWRYYVSSKS